MISANDIRELRTASRDYETTQDLKQRLAELRSDRTDFYLTSKDFDAILKWKLRGQYGRQSERRLSNTDEIIRVVTRLAFSIEHEDKDYEVELRIKILCSLRGVEVPVASALLTLVFPDKYAVVDFRGWRQIFSEDRNTFTVPQYRKYLAQIRELAQDLGWLVQETDLAIWEYDFRMHG
ncbi:MAG TPA: hypothetical protein VOA88_01185 [Candidatus Dormibacteraeota bacterium]|nr:hypothetical protein [Candidatus Dormibacteraeota bacterium]